MHRYTIAGLILNLATLPVVGGAQELPTAGVGSRVRVTVTEPRSRLTGTVLEIGPDSIRIDGGKSPDQRVVARDGIERLELSLGHHPRTRRALAVGALVGGATAAVVIAGANLFGGCDPPTGGGWFVDYCSAAPSFGESIAIVGLLAATTAVGGALVDFAAPGEVWGKGRWAEAASKVPSTARPSFKLGLGRTDGHVVAKVGLQWRW